MPTPAIIGQKTIEKSCCIDRSQKKKLAEAKARPLPICFDDPPVRGASLLNNLDSFEK